MVVVFESRYYSLNFWPLSFLYLFNNLEGAKVSLTIIIRLDEPY
jgi:hypothetical protein